MSRRPAKFSAWRERISGQRWHPGSRLSLWELSDFLPDELELPEGAILEAFALATQACDLAAVGTADPCFVAMPVLRWPEKRLRPQPNSPRYFPADGDSGLFVWAGILVQVPKHRLPNRRALSVLRGRDVQHRYQAWCARRWSRPALDDDFNASVTRVLSRALGKVGSYGGCLGETLAWRAEFKMNSGVVLRCVYDDSNVDQASMAEYVAAVRVQFDALRVAVEARWDQTPRQYPPSCVEEMLAVPAREYSLADALLEPMLVDDELSSSAWVDAETPPLPAASDHLLH